MLRASCRLRIEHPKAPATFELRRRSVCAGALAVASALVSSPSLANPPPDAKDLFARARALRLAGDCVNAVPLFRQAHEIYPSGLGSLRNLAECEESLGHFASARRDWLDLQHTLLSHSETKYEGWAMDAQEGAARLAPKVATLTVDTEPFGSPFDVADLDVMVNGERLEAQRMGTPVDLDPGRCVIVVGGAHGFATQERVVDLRPGDAKRVFFQVGLPSPPSLERRESVPGAARPPAGPDLSKRTAAWVSMGVGAASFTAAAIAAIAYEGALDNLNTVCPASHCNPALTSQSNVDAIVQRGRTASMLVNVFVAGGAVGIGAGIILFSTGHSTGAKTALVASPTSVSATGQF